MASITDPDYVPPKKLIIEEGVIKLKDGGDVVEYLKQ